MRQKYARYRRTGKKLTGFREVSVSSFLRIPRCTAE
jgi:hypothetical protein